MSKIKFFVGTFLSVSVLLMSGCNQKELPSIGSATQMSTSKTSVEISTNNSETTPSSVLTSEHTTTSKSVSQSEISSESKTTTTSSEPHQNTTVTTTTTTTKKPAVVTTTTTTKKATTTITPKKTTTTTKKATTTTTTTKKKTTTTTKKVTTTTKVTSTKDYPYDNKTYEYMAEVVRLCNIERAEAGLSPLTLDPTVTKGAMIRANEIINYFSHTRPDGNSCFTALEEVGANYMTAGENIACGYVSPEDVVDGWINSEGHRANILNENFNKIGVGYVYSSSGIYRHYWVQMFTD